MLLIAGMDVAYAKIQLKPMIMVQIQQDSNFYRTEINEREVYTYSVTPGVNLASKTKKSNIYVNYSLTYNSYDYQDPAPTPADAANDKDSFTEHAVMLEGDYAINYLTTAKIGASYNKTIDQAHGDVLSNTMERREFDVLRVKPLIKGAFPIFKKFPLELGYRYTNLDFSDSQYQDSTEGRIMADTYYKFGNEKNERMLGLQYHHWWTTYSGGSASYDTSDYQADQVRLTGHNQFDNFSFDAGVGYQLRTFDDKSKEDLDSISVSLTLKSGQLLKLFGKKADVTAKAIRNLNANDGGEGYFTGDRFSLDLGYNILKSFGVVSKFQGVWQRSQYDEGIFNGREDNTYRLAALLGYQWNILGNITIDLGLKGGYEWRESNWEEGQAPNYKGYDFENTYIALMLSTDLETAGFFGVYDDDTPSE
ncbi:hypothetical protein QUF90_11060 [Desulfococcaceae bacterium HSG9]|nr:hypothetical protein [Desulfococcaceae bacterium HSG9]